MTRASSTRRVGALAGLALAASFAVALTNQAFASATPGPSATTGTSRATGSSTASGTQGATGTEGAAHRTQRLCAAPAHGHLACLAIRQVDPTEPATITANAVTPNATPSGFGPSSLQSAYALPSSTAGSGQTIAIVDAQDDPNAESDLATYRSQYGLSACTTANGCFKKVNQSGAASPLPSADTGWAGEISLDVDMVSAICPNCKMLLVEPPAPQLPTSAPGLTQP